ncbi:MAG TPA: hypothetical protein VF782_04770 [Allosphingosinicella sp.]|jgi:YD repeat-containing protein
MKGRNRNAIMIAAAGLAAAASAAIAAETIVYRYDARGRLVKVERSGTVNNNVVTNYTFDKADNRTVKTTTGSPNPPPP